MKKLNFVLIAVVLTSAIAFTTSCSKKKGCTDSTSTNYDAKAKDDDGSCTYNGKAVFWYNEATADSLVANGITSITFYVDGQIVETLDSLFIPVWYETSSPGCDDAEAFSIIVTKDLGNVKTKSFSYSSKDQNGETLFSGTIEVTANSCNSIQLTF